jgi:hypothetical protein
MRSNRKLKRKKFTPQGANKKEKKIMDVAELSVACDAEQTAEEALEEWLCLTQILAPEFTAAPYIERDGAEFRVYCHDGGCWDRPTLWGKFGSLQDAMECVKHGPVWRRSANDLQKK